MKLDPRGSAVLGEDACRRRLTQAAAASGIGRIAINGERSPYVIPVNFTVVDGGIVIRLGTGWAAFHLDGAPVTFETDQAVAPRHFGWSVVVEGVAREVPYEEVARLDDVILPTPIVTEPGFQVFEIIPFKVTGRAVEPDLRGEQRELSAEWPEITRVQPRNLYLEQDGADELASLLRSVLGDLTSEIADTDDATRRKALLERRRLLDAIAAQVVKTDVI
jgi:hypothetical protein